MSTEVAVSPEALAAAIAKATFEAAQAATRREVDPPPANAIGYLMADMPALRFKEVRFCGAPQKVDFLKPSEVTLYNAITTPGFYGPDKTWEVRIKDDTLSIAIQGVNKRDVRMDLPRSLEDLLRTIVNEQNAVAA